MKNAISFLLLLITTSVVSQPKYTISGYIKDAKTGEDLIGATLFCKELATGTISNAYGFFSLTVPGDKYQLQCSFIGYNSKVIPVEVNTNITLKIELSPKISAIEEVVVSAVKENDNVRSAKMGVVKLQPKAISTIPVVFGEQDVLKTIQLLPGVKAGNEASTGFHVRGGGADQNLILLDEAPVYNSGHLLGFFSVFNSDAIKDFTLYKGNFPASYGGRLSSVLDIRMKEGNQKKTNVSGGIGLISSRLTVEAPLIEDKSSFIISGRRTYADLFLKLAPEEEMKNTTIYFYDLNAKANYKINDNNRLYISGYLGKDRYKTKQATSTKIDFGNTTASLRWNHVFNPKLFLNSTLIYSKYTNETGVSNKNISSTIKDFNLKGDFNYFLTPSNTLRFGLNMVHHTFRPGEVTSEGGSSGDLSYEDKKAIESGVYLSHELKYGNKLSFDYGLRYSMFTYLGPGKISTFDENGSEIETKEYSKDEVIKNYYGFEPRITANFILNTANSVKASYSRNRQYIHMVTNSTSATNFDVWQPSTNNVKPEIADQYALGYFRNFKKNMYEASIEGYYKNLRNQIEYRDGADVLFSSAIESEYVYGKGQAYGVELFARKNKGRLTGWLSYTLGRTERKFNQINNGNTFPARYDRTHDFSVTGIYKLNERISLSASWIYYTGNATTYPSGKYTIEHIVTPFYTERNSYRMPNYHRLDLGLTLEGKKNKNRKYQSSWNFSLYNAYGRQNPYMIQFKQDTNNKARTIAEQTAMFSFVPSITYNFKF